MEPGQQKKRGFLDRLPKMGRVSQLVLVIGIFLVILIPLWVINQQQPEKQRQLEATLSNLQKIITPEQTSQAKFEADLAQALANTEAAKASFPGSQAAPQILDTLQKLADTNDVSISATKVSTDAGKIGPVLTITLNLRGQVPNFQNFLLGLDTELPASQISQFSTKISGVAAEYDTATVVMNIQCYGGD